MQRLFTQAEIGLYMETVRDFIAAEFGEENCSDLAHWQDYFARGYQRREVYGDFTGVAGGAPPLVLGTVSCALISHAELAALKRGDLKDIEIKPRQAGDGKAVAWIYSVISAVPGVAAKCIAALITQVEALPVYPDIDRIAVFCTGPQGYLMSAAFGLVADGASYEDGWPFMERAISPEEFSVLGRALQQVWTMTKAKDVVKSARTLWGHDWRKHVLEAREYARGNR